MRVRRHYRIDMGLRLVDEGRLQVTKEAVEPHYGRVGPKPTVRRHLVIARTPGVQLPRDASHFLTEQPLDERMDMLVRRAIPLGPCPTLQSIGDPIETLGKLPGFVLGEHAGSPQRRGPSLAPPD